MDDILTKKEGTRVVKCHDHIEIVVNGSGEHLFFKQRDGPYFPSLRLVHKCKYLSSCPSSPFLNRCTHLDPFMCPLMQVDQGAITFVLSGANIMCPGLTSKGANMTPGLPVGQVVTVVAEGKEHALAVGVIKMTPEEM